MDKIKTLSIEGAAGLLLSLIAWIGVLNWQGRFFFVLLSIWLLVHLVSKITENLYVRLIMIVFGAMFIFAATWRPILEGAKGWFDSGIKANPSDIKKFNISILRNQPAKTKEQFNDITTEITHASPEFLKNMLEDKYGEKREEIKSQFIGKWLSISGKMYSNTDYDKIRGYRIGLEENGFESDYLYFDDTNREYVVTRSKGQDIHALCQIEDITIIYLELIHCQPK